MLLKQTVRQNHHPPSSTRATFIQKSTQYNCSPAPSLTAHLCMQVCALVRQPPAASARTAAATPATCALQLVARHWGAMIRAGRRPGQGQPGGRGMLQLQGLRR